jgi:electron transport complex protein RnfE
MTSFLRFFILALTPLLGVTGSLGPAFLFGLVATLLLVAVSGLVFLTKEKLGQSALLWSSLGLAVALVTLIDLVTSLWLPGLRAAWGIYLNLLAFSPLIVLPLERTHGAVLGAELSATLKTGLGLTGLLVGTAFVREALGQGTLTLIPGTLGWDLPGLKQYPLTILSTGAGGFFLAAAGVVVYRLLTPRWKEEAQAVPVSAPPPAGTEPTARTTEPTTVPVAQSSAPAEPAPVAEPAGEWGETLAAVVGEFGASGSAEQRRLLVIGSGNGELVYYLAMLCLEQARGTGFAFRVRGVDHFSTRVETAVRGVYRDHQIELIGQALRESWMERGEGEDRFFWKVGNEPRQHVQFEVADFQQGQVFFPQACHLIVLNQGIEYVNDEKKAHLLKTDCDQLQPGGALVVTGAFKRELLPEGMKRTGTTVFRRA